MTAEEDQAYKVLSKRFGFSPRYIKSVLEAHFETPSDAGWEHVSQEQQAVTTQEESRTIALTAEEVRDTFYLIDKMRADGVLPPLVRHIAIDWFKRDKRGKYYLATEQQLQEELRIQEDSSIDPDGNLVVNGQVVKYGWLQSFAKKDR